MPPYADTIPITDSFALTCLRGHRGVNVIIGEAYGLDVRVDQPGRVRMKDEQGQATVLFADDGQVYLAQGMSVVPLAEDCHAHDRPGALRWLRRHDQQDRSNAYVVANLITRMRPR